MKIIIKDEQKKEKINIKKFKEVMAKALKIKDEGESEVSVLLVDNKEIKKLNNTYRKKKEETDVLAFPMREGKSHTINSHILGDIAISIEKAKEQAQKYKQNFNTELYRLAIHGFLHLLGYKDYTPKDRKKMEEKTERILEEAQG
jgi:probable rRNA maturation factor